MRGVRLLLTTGSAAGLVVAIAIGSVWSIGRMGAEDRRHTSPVPTPQTLLAGQQQQAAKAYADLPVSFVENRGQTDARVRYYAQGNGYGFFLTPSEVMLSFANGRPAAEQQTPESSPSRSAVRRQATRRSSRRARSGPGVINDLRGSDPSQWHTEHRRSTATSSTPTSGRTSTCACASSRAS